MRTEHMSVIWSKTGLTRNSFFYRPFQGGPFVALLVVRVLAFSDVAYVLSLFVNAFAFGVSWLWHFLGILTDSIAQTYPN